MSDYDVFVSHASEDKADVARPLAALLIQTGLSVWIDEAELKLGDSLRRSIDSGLASSRFGVVILSKSFFAKEWPQKELDALVAREDGSEKVILPVWHNITANEIARFSPLLADRLGVKTENGLPAVVAAISNAVGRSPNSSARRPQATTTSSVDTNAISESPRGALEPGARRIDQLVVELIDYVTEIADSQSEIVGVRTGLSDLDRLLSGLSPGELYVSAALPSIGNTTLALNVVSHVAVSEGLPVVYFSPHATGKEILNRLIASTGRIDRRGLLVGQLNEDEWKRFASTVEKVHNAPIYIDDSSVLTVDHILRQSREIKTSAGAIGLIVIDSLETLAPEHAKPEDNAIRSLRFLAKELQCPLLLLMSVSRATLDARASKRPILKDLSARDAIERYASAVFCLYRDDYYNPDTAKPGILELIVASNRTGPTATIELAFMKTIGRLENLTYAPNAKNDA